MGGWSRLGQMHEIPAPGTDHTAASRERHDEDREPREEDSYSSTSILEEGDRKDKQGRGDGRDRDPSDEGSHLLAEPSKRFIREFEQCGAQRADAKQSRGSDDGASNAMDA